MMTKLIFTVLTLNGACFGSEKVRVMSLINFWIETARHICLSMNFKCLINS